MSQFGGREIIQEWVVNVGGDVDDLRRAMREVTSETRRAQSNARRAARSIRESFRRSFGVIRTGAVAAAAGLGVVVGVLGSINELTMRAERRNRALARGLHLTGQEAKAVQRDFNDTADSLRTLGGVLRRDFMGTSARLADRMQFRDTSPEQIKAMAVAVEGLTERFKHHGQTRQQIERIIERAHRGDMEGLRELIGDTDRIMDDMQVFRAGVMLAIEGIIELEKAGRGPRAQLKALRDEIVQVVTAAGKAAGIGENVSQVLARVTRFVRGLQEPIADVVSSTRDWVRELNLIERGHAALQLGIPGIIEGFRQVWEEVRIKAAEAFNWIEQNAPTGAAELVLAAWTRTIDEIQTRWDRFRAAVEHPIQAMRFRREEEHVEDRFRAHGMDTDDPENREAIRHFAMQRLHDRGEAEDILKNEMQIAKRREHNEEQLQERIRQIREGVDLIDVQAMREAAQERRAEFRKEHQERLALIREERREREKLKEEAGGGVNDELAERLRLLKDLIKSMSGQEPEDKTPPTADTIQTALGSMRVGNARDKVEQNTANIEKVLKRINDLIDRKLGSFWSAA